MTIRLYLLDVEGTTSPLSLVSEQLFPYARKHLAAFLADHVDDLDVHADLLLLAEQNQSETEPAAPRVDADFDVADDLEQAAAYLLWLMDKDRKSTALKSLQGKIWKAGFLAGELVGTVFPDVPKALKRWSAQGRVAIYSSGSVEAQKLLFRYSSAGDLTPYLSGYFDTRMGRKTSPASYRGIAEQVQATPKSILFVSDVVLELDAAREAGCQTRLSVREGNATVENAGGHVAIASFDEIDPE